MNKQESLRAYVPPEVAAQWNDIQSDMWRRGSVAMLLIAAGVPIISAATIPTICYRINMLNQSTSQEKIAMGMPIAEVDIKDVITPDLLHAFIGATVANGDYATLSDAAFIEKMVNGLQVLPKIDILAVTTQQLTAMNRADAELSEGASE